MLPTLVGHRLYLRHINTADADALFSLYADANTMRFAADPVFTHMDMMQQMLSSVASLYASGESYEWALVLSDSEHIVGTCGLHSFNTERTRCEVGCLLASPFWGQGLMQDALSLLLSHAKQLGITHLLADIEPQNHRARRFFTKLGFHCDANGLFSLELN
ncbi:GNAT family N-acetyltransferase [Bowmanella pacifica]|uniref:N-acetyltransferase n=1 Tax=Bowmanella pacifica TaxID=502051 RepID=A0A918DJ16_9ALTE|nr:GNAT family N-acetyltransferase [Bowmanella pacifica]GGO69502.1 N-acetyltransferase [Bowmanella pacifica]